MRTNTPIRIFVHTTDADYNKIPNQFYPVNRWHKNRKGWDPYCKSSLGYYGAYTILISNGKEYRYREDWEETCAVKGYNISSLSVAIGFDGDIQMPKPKDVELLRARLEKWCRKYNIPTDDVEFVSPHRKVAPQKTCFGSLLPDDWAVKLLRDIDGPVVVKDRESRDKKKMIEAERKVAIDALQQAILRLKILIGRYIKSLNRRQKTPPKVG